MEGRRNAEPGRELEWLFVYGTLRRGFPRHAILTRLGAQYKGRGKVAAQLFDLDNYPAARPSPVLRRRVVGELYRLRNPAQALRMLDRVEDFRRRNPASSPYRREAVLVTGQNGETVRAWIYWLNRWPAVARCIPSGDYVKKRG